VQARLQGEQLMQRTLRQRSDRLDRQAAAAAQAQQQQQQQHASDTSQQQRDQTKPAAGTAKSGSMAKADTRDDGAWTTVEPRKYMKAKCQQH
jgi:hypothetical protein